MLFLVFVVSLVSADTKLIVQSPGEIVKEPNQMSMHFGVSSEVRGIFSKKEARAKHSEECTPVRDAINKFLKDHGLSRSKIRSEEVRDYGMFGMGGTKIGTSVTTSFSVRLEDVTQATSLSDTVLMVKTNAKVSLQEIVPQLSKQKSRDAIKECLKEAYQHAQGKVEALASAGGNSISQIVSVKELTQTLVNTASMNSYSSGTSTVSGGTNVKAGKLHFKCNIEMEANVQKTIEPTTTTTTITIDDTESPDK